MTGYITVFRRRLVVPVRDLPRAEVCPDCGAIIGRGAESYPGNHWEWCKGVTA